MPGNQGAAERALAQAKRALQALRSRVEAQSAAEVAVGVPSQRTLAGHPKKPSAPMVILDDDNDWLGKVRNFLGFQVGSDSRVRQGSGVRV